MEDRAGRHPAARVAVDVGARAGGLERDLVPQTYDWSDVTDQEMLAKVGVPARDPRSRCRTPCSGSTRAVTGS